MSLIFKPKISNNFYSKLIEFEKKVKKYVDTVSGFSSLGYVILDDSYPGWALKEMKSDDKGNMITLVEENEFLCEDKLVTHHPEIKDFMDHYHLEFLLGSGPFFAWPAHRHNIIEQRYAMSVPDLSHNIPVSLYTKINNSDMENYMIDVENNVDVVFLEEFEFLETDRIIIFPGGKDIYHGTDPKKTAYQKFYNSYNRLFHIKDFTSKEKISEYCRWIETI